MFLASMWWAHFALGKKDSSCSTDRITTRKRKEKKRKHTLLSTDSIFKLVSFVCEVHLFYPSVSKMKFSHVALIALFVLFQCIALSNAIHFKCTFKKVDDKPHVSHKGDVKKDDTPRLIRTSYLSKVEGAGVNPLMLSEIHVKYEDTLSSIVKSPYKKYHNKDEIVVELGSAASLKKESSYSVVLKGTSFLNFKEVSQEKLQCASAIQGCLRSEYKYTYEANLKDCLVVSDKGTTPYEGGSGRLQLRVVMDKVSKPPAVKSIFGKGIKY